MSVVSRNPFDALGEDGDSPAPVKAPAAATTGAAAKKATETVQRDVPGSGRGGRGGRGGDRGSRPSRGTPREDRGPRHTAQEPASGVAEGFEDPAGFDGERVAPPKKAHHGPDRHTKNPNNRGGYTSGGHSSRGSGAVRGAKTPAFGGERRQFERRSGGYQDSQKKVESGWGANEGSAELSAEVEGEKDAADEETAPQTPAAEGDGGRGASDEPTAAATGFGDDAEETPEEPEEVQKSYEEYLAEKAAAALEFGKKEVRQVSEAALEGTAFVREGIVDFFSGKEKTTTKAAKPKKEKVFIEVDGQFARPASDRPTRGGDRGRGGRGGGRGGDRGGRGRGAPRGARGGFGGANSRGGAQGLNSTDEKAFPALGA